LILFRSSLRQPDADRSRGSRSARFDSGLGITAVKVYVGNLPFTATEDEIRDLFGEYGQVNDVTMISDRETGRPRGFGFIEFQDEAAGREAISQLDGKDFGGRQLKVNEARPRADRGDRR